MGNSVSSGKKLNKKTTAISTAMYNLRVHATVFIDLFDSRESRMSSIVEEFENIAAKVKRMHQDTDEKRKTGAITAGIGIGASLLAAPFSGGLSLVGAAAGLYGTAVVGTTNVVKMVLEDGSAEKVKKWANEFLELVKPLRKELDDIKRACQELQKGSADSKARVAFVKMNEFQRLAGNMHADRHQNILNAFQNVIKLTKMSGGILGILETLVPEIAELVSVIVKILNFTPSPDDDRNFQNSITEVAKQGQKVIDQCNEIKEQLNDLRFN